MVTLENFWGALPLELDEEQVELAFLNPFLGEEHKENQKLICKKLLSYKDKDLWECTYALNVDELKDHN